LQLAYLIASNLNITIEQRQEILEENDFKKLLELITRHLTQQLETLELSKQIQEKVKADLDKNQREFFLRQQLKAIQKELGIEDERSVEIQELKERLEKTKMPEEARKAAERELDRLSKMPPGAAEYTVSRTYLEWLLELPWEVSTEDRLDIDEAAAILDKDHFDLEKVKKRILEYLAVLKLKRDMKGPILCFVGPPGVGKTSLGQSIAESLGRKFIRISLGGVRDEAELRGHRRTYVGALPGRIIQGLRRAGSNNPVFMLDEVDKLGYDFRGDPSSALLEILDPEQNHNFSDHYIEVPFDLSRVMFIATANLLEPIPPALQDRMEVLELPGYTPEEKLQIAKKYLIPEQLENHGLTSEMLQITDEAVSDIIRLYTKEAGVRNLERQIAAICRSVAKNVVSGKKGLVVVDAKDLEKILGPIKYIPEMAARVWGPGLATGLAWTPVGGDIIFIEATKMKGKGQLILTGQLGDVMKESATAALSYVRSQAEALGIDDEIFGKTDVHIHVPAGAIPKDGPSAGIAMVMALISLFQNRETRKDVAMTGEITLRGEVLPVGGIKEKVLAAKRSGITNVILPALNEKDLVEVSEPLKEGMKFHFVNLIPDALKVVFANGKDQ
ncbi:MAG: endopeptidase La, partial [Deltaproteobacteria bacterium]